MSTPQPTLQTIIETLRSEQLLQSDDKTLAELKQRLVPQPWYIRTMVGIGAWLASLMLIGFIVSLELFMANDELLIFIIGIALIVGALLVRYRTEGDFLIQCALASSLAGQALLAFAVTHFVNNYEFEVFLGVALMVSLILLIVYPDHIHRIIMLLLATSTLTCLLYVWELSTLIPFLGPLLAGMLIVLHNRLPKLAGSDHAMQVLSLTTGLMLSAFGVLMLSTVYLLPELNISFVFYPHPWISTLLLGAEFLYLGHQIKPVISPSEKGKYQNLLYGLMLLIVASAWYAPGLILGLIVLLLGVEHGRTTFIGVGIAFFALFLCAYFYGLEVSLLTKSITLIASGLAIWLSRWVILRLATLANTKTEQAHG
jgi:MFS family permease